MANCDHAILAFVVPFVFFNPILLCLAEDRIEPLGPPNDVIFISKLDGTEQRYVIRLPGNFTPEIPSHLLIALHGHGADRFQFANDARDECDAARTAAMIYNMIYVSPDYRAKTSWMGPAAIADVRQILDDLHRQYRIGNVYVCGGSMGGTSALAFATMHPECVDGVVSMNGTANLVEYEGFADAIAASYGGTKTEKPNEYRQRSAELFPERLTMPVGLTTGGGDTLVPPDSTLRLAESLKDRGSPVCLIHRPDGGHATNRTDALVALHFVIGQTIRSVSAGKPLLMFGGTPRTIVCLGDSVTGVYYHSGGRRAYPEMLEIGLKRLHPKLPIKVVNAGISGQTTQDGLARLDQDVFQHHPDLVTISFGLNDVTRLSADAYQSNLESIIKKCLEHDCQVLLCTPNSVIDTAARPIEKLESFCEVLRNVGRQMSVPVCDQYREGIRLRDRAPWTWRLTLSDEIHPNMDGHKRMAELLCRVIDARSISLDYVPPPQPSLVQTKRVLHQQRPVRVLAMSPYETLIGDAIKGLDESATVEITPWPVAGKTLSELEQQAKSLVRSLKPDLVILAIPREATAENDEQFVHSYSWIMNWSLSFGQQEWDCLVVDPSVTAAEVTGPREELSRRLIHAQHLDLIDRPLKSQSSPTEILMEWFRNHRDD